MRFLTLLLLLYSHVSNGQVYDTTILSATYPIYFDTNESTIDEQDHMILDSVINQVGTEEISKISLVGSTDSKGGNAYNKKLAEARAVTIRDYMSKLGVNKALISIAAIGEQKAVLVGDNLDLPDERKVEVQVYKSLQLRKFKGQIVDDSTGVGVESVITLQSKGYQDSTMTSPDGTYSLSGPEKQFAILTIQKKNYLEVEKRIKISALLDKYPLITKLPALTLGRIVSFGKIYFYGNSPQMLPTSKREVQRLYRTLSRSDVCVELRGHVNLPNAEEVDVLSNYYVLSQKRAKAVYREMIKQGVAASRMTHNGYGNWHMVRPNAKKEEEMKLNRRVEIQVINCATKQ